MHTPSRGRPPARAPFYSRHTPVVRLVPNADAAHRWQRDAVGGARRRVSRLVRPAARRALVAERVRGARGAHARRRSLLAGLPRHPVRIGRRSVRAAARRAARSDRRPGSARRPVRAHRSAHVAEPRRHGAERAPHRDAELGGDRRDRARPAPRPDHRADARDPSRRERGAPARERRPRRHHLLAARAAGPRWRARAAVPRRWRAEGRRRR